MKLIKPSYEVWDRNVDPLALIEKAGRVCYQSEPRGNPEGFVHRILSRKPPHGSVLEHAWFGAQRPWSSPIPRFFEFDEDTGVMYGNARAWREAVESGDVNLPRGLVERWPVLFDGIDVGANFSSYDVQPAPDGLVFTVSFTVDRGVSHELVRHRPPSFSQESTRFCDYGGDVTFIIPPWVTSIAPGEYQYYQFAKDRADDQWFRAMMDAEFAYKALLANKWMPQQARSVLPNSLKTQIVVTAWWTEWQIIFALRCHEAAHPQMREVMRPLRTELSEKWPDKFGDAAIAEVRDRLG